MEPEKLKEILEKHKKWLNNEPGGERADLREANLDAADLYRAVTDVVSAGPVGSRLGITYYNLAADELQCGCFRGTLDEFAAKAAKTHADHPRYLAEYRAVIEFFRSVREARKSPAKEAA
jgi:hypothetical protein